jgi:hypothetical protein
MRLDDEEWDVVRASGARRHLAAKGSRHLSCSADNW